MKIHNAGNKIIIEFFVFFLILNILLYYYIGNALFVRYIFPAFSIFCIGFVVRFFRNPERPFDTDEDGVVFCPADGKIVTIEEVEETEYLNEKCMLVSVFMSINDVHVNWYPISGIVKYVKYHKGKYLVAWHPKSSTLNERNTIVIENEKGSILMRQIAGYVARKIVSKAKVGDKAAMGEKFGIIKFGSRVDLFLPLDANINVELSQKVSAGKTIIAKLK